MVSHLKRDSEVALYVQLASCLAQEIADGHYAPFDRLPTEEELTTRFGVSRVTVRQAIDRLRRQGVVVSKQGKGTFVKGSVVIHELAPLKGFYETLLSQGLHPDVELLAFGMQTVPDGEAGELRLEKGRAVQLKRRYCLDGHPFALVSGWLTPDAKNVTRELATLLPVYSILQELLGISIKRARLNIIARSATSDESETLGLEPDSPLLVMERVSYSDSDEPCEAIAFSVLPESYRFTLDVRGPLSVTPAIQSVKTSDREP